MLWEPTTLAKEKLFCAACSYSHQTILYQNKYEMYEWIQEAIVKGMTDVHEIQRYARQKEIGLYGA